MLSLALLTPNALAARGIEQLAEESGLFRIVSKESTLSPAGVVLRALAVRDPEIVLFDLSDWEKTRELAEQIRDAEFRSALIGFTSSDSPADRQAFVKAGIEDLLPDPFSPAEIEAAAYEAVHRKRPVTHGNILVFVPAKAGGGCSTVLLNTAAALTGILNQRTLLIEADRRSGVLSILLNLRPAKGLAEALGHAAEMTGIEWHQYYKTAFGMQLLLADPAQRGSLPSWADYYHLLRFVEKQYDFVFADMPEIVNQASAELVRSARGVFVVCTPEVPSLKMASYRCAELEACEIPAQNLHIVLNRWESDRLSVSAVEGILGRSVFATVPNDYARVTQAIMDSHLVASDSDFAESCRQLARKVSGLPEAPQPRSKFDLLKRLGRFSS